MFETRLTDHGVLRLLEPQDAMAVFSAIHQHRAELQRWYAWVSVVQSPEVVTGFIHQALSQYAQGLGYHAGLWVDNTLMGVVGYAQPIDFENRSARLGYWITPEAYGKGWVTQALTHMIHHAFGAYGLHRVTFRALAHHARSQTVPAKLGFQEEGTLSQAYLLSGQRHDLKLYAMTAPQWQARCAQEPRHV